MFIWLYFLLLFSDYEDYENIHNMSTPGYHRRTNFYTLTIISFIFLFTFLTPVTHTLHRWQHIGSSQGRRSWESRRFYLFGLLSFFPTSWLVWFYLSGTDNVRLQGGEGQPVGVREIFLDNLDVRVYCVIFQTFHEDDNLHYTMRAYCFEKNSFGAKLNLLF